MAPVPLVEPLQRRADARVVAQRQQRLEVAHRPAGVGGEILSRERGVLEQLAARGEILGARDDLVVEREELAPALAEVVRQLEALEGPRGVRRQIHRPTQQRDHRLLIVEPLLVVLDRAPPELLDRLALGVELRRVAPTPSARRYAAAT